MHRARCLTQLAAAVLLIASGPHSTWARQTPASHAVTVAAHHRRTHRRHSSEAPKHPALKDLPVEPGRLGVRMKLGDGRQMWHPTRRQIGVAYAPGVTEQTPRDQVKFVVDRKKLRAYLNRIAPYVRRRPQDAKVVVVHAGPNDDGSGQIPANIIPGYDGAVLNVDQAVDHIEKVVESDPKEIHIVLPVKTKPAKITTADLKGINARVGYFVTHFNPGDEGRTATVRRAIDIIDGSVVPPGKVFSVDNTVGPRDPAHGFWGKGHVFVDGKMEVQSGGGMCQVGTTLFNAVMMANLKVVERHQHVRTIPYADPGRDATIYHGQKDFRFQNDTAAPVYIKYVTTGSHAIVSLFAKSVPGRKVRLVSHHRQIAERHYTGSFWRVVTYADGRKEKSAPFYSNYKWTPALDFSR